MINEKEAINGERAGKDIWEGLEGRSRMYLRDDLGENESGQRRELEYIWTSGICDLKEYLFG